MSKDKGDRITTYIVGTGIALAAVGALYLASSKDAQQQAKPAQGNTTTVSPRPQNELSLELYVSKTDGKIIEAVGLQMNEGARQDLFRSGPVFYDIPGVFPHPVQWMVPAGSPGIRIELPVPQSLEGKVIHVYRIDPVTKEEKTIFRADMATKK